MADLFITPTRWDLLGDIDADEVRDGDDYGMVVVHEPSGRRVTSAMGGLVLHKIAEPYGSAGQWRLTVEGKRRLAAHTCNSCRGYTPQGPTCRVCRGRADD